VLVINARKFGIAEIEEAIQKVPGSQRLTSRPWTRNLAAEGVSPSLMSRPLLPSFGGADAKGRCRQLRFWIRTLPQHRPGRRPRTANGKLQRYKLAEILASAQSIAIAKKPDLARTQSPRLDRSCRVFLAESSTPEDSFFDLGGDSLSAVLALPP